MSRGRLVATVLAVLIAVAGIELRPFGQRVSPRLAVSIKAADPGAMSASGLVPRRSTTTKAWTDRRDPWGRPLIVLVRRGKSEREWVIYSAGPDGVDEDGSGDDVVPTPLERELGRRFAAGPVGLYALAALLLWLAHGPFVRTRRSESLASECVRAVTLASGPTFVVPWIGAALLLGDLPRLDELEPLVPLGFVDPVYWVVGGSGLLCFFTALAWRLTRPIEGVGGGEMTIESEPPRTPTEPPKIE